LPKLSQEEKIIAEIARWDWNEQCKKFLQGIPFRDKSAKACYERHKKDYYRSVLK
jgi:hypothetical protein